MSQAHWMQQRIKGYVGQAQALVEHKGERGAVAEKVVMQALREFLPGKFSLGTGFLQSASGRSSKQQDIVVYDAFHNAPTVLPGGAGIFPIECVYATVEVTLTGSAAKVRRTLKAVAEIRGMAKEKVYVEPTSMTTEEDKTVAGPLRFFNFKPGLAPRAFFFAVKASVTQAAIEAALQSNTDAHLHGALFLNDNWFYAHQAYKPGLAHAPERAFATFLMSVRENVENFSMATGYIGPYLGEPPVELKYIEPEPVPPAASAKLP